MKTYIFIICFLLGNMYSVICGQNAKEEREDQMSVSGTDPSLLIPISQSPIPPKGAIYADPSQTPETRTWDLIRRLTFEEKCKLSGGWNRFLIPGIERLGVRPVSMADASQGVRLKTSVIKDKSTSFPGMLPLASTWNADLAKRFGTCISEECRALGVDILLGPGINMQRLSVGGRNFEYMGEDPFFTSRIAVSYIQGLQSNKVIAVPKHFIGNDQEFVRHIASINIAPRALREIYLPPWEAVIKEAGSMGMMTGNNQADDVPMAMNHNLVKGVLRDEYGFRGIAMTDWQNSQYHPMRQHLILTSGMSLMMPDNGAFMKYIDEEVAKSPERKMEIEAMMESMIYHNIYPLFAFGIYDREFQTKELFNTFEGHKKIARQTAEEAIVLLKNEKNILPISKNKKILMTGSPEIHSGAGSGFVTGYDHTTYAEGLEKIYGINFTYKEKAIDAEIKKADIVIFSLNKPSGEGRDIPFAQPEAVLDDLRRVIRLNKNIIVLVNASNVMPMDWLPQVKGVLWCYFLGQERGNALAAVVSGEAVPSGKLPFTIEKKFEDSPAPRFNYIAGSPYWRGNNEYKNYWLGDEKAKGPEQIKKNVKPHQPIPVPYSEGLFIGYRWYDKNKIEVHFPFGFGLSYSSFEYSNLRIDNTDSPEIKVFATVKNTGKYKAKEVAQLYVSKPSTTVEHPEKELKAFAKIELDPGEAKEVSFKLNDRSFSYWDEQINDWKIQTGDHIIRIGGSSANLPLTSGITIE